MDIAAYMYRVKSVMHSLHVTSCEQNTVHLGKVHLISQGGGDEDIETRNFKI